MLQMVILRNDLDWNRSIDHQINRILESKHVGRILTYSVNRTLIG